MPGRTAHRRRNRPITTNSARQRENEKPALWAGFLLHQFQVRFRLARGVDLRGGAALSSTSVLLFQPTQHVVELIEIAVADGENAAALAMIDADSQTERVGNALFKRDHIGVFVRPHARFAPVLLSLFAFLPDRARYCLDLAHIETASDDFFR